MLTYPTIATREHLDNKGWDTFNKISTSDNWLIFTSENGIRYFIKQLKNQGKDIRLLADYRIAVIGGGTQKALEEYYLKADFIPDKATTATFADQFVSKYNLKDANVFRVRGNFSIKNIDEAVVKAGGNLIPMTVYETYYPKWPEETVEKFRAYPPDIIIFSSGTTVDGLFESLGSEDIEKFVKPATIASIGPSTSKEIVSSGLKVTYESKIHTIPGLIDELVEYVKANPMVE